MSKFPRGRQSISAKKSGCAILAILVGLASNTIPGAAAQDAPAALPASALAAPAVASPCASALAEGRTGTCLPALTPVIIELGEPLSSRSSVTGDHFKIALSAPIVVGGQTVVPAGATGQGEVVFAKKTGVGVGGELVLAARFVTFQDHPIRLRSMQLTGEGKDQQGLAFAVGVAVGFPALFVRGKHIDIPSGALAHAKTAEATWIDRPADPPAPSL